MAIYTVELDGDQFDIEGPDNASDQDLEAFVRQNRSNMKALPKGQQEQPFNLGRETAKLAGETLMTPIRGTRALGVLGQKALQAAIPGGQEPTMEQALSRASEATKPGFQPQEGEKLGSFIGEQAGFAGLTAPATAIKGSLTAGKVLSSGAVSGGLAAVQNMADEGKVDVKGTLRAAALGAAFPLVVPTIGFIARAVKAVGKTLGTSGSTISREALDEVSKIPLGQRRKFEGVQQKVEDLQKGIFGALDEAGSELNKARQKLGLTDLKTARLESLKKQGEKLRPIQDVLEEADQRMAATETSGGAASLKILDDIVHELDQHIEFAGKEGRSLNQAALKGVRSQIKDKMATLPGGDILRAFEKEYSVIKGASDDLFSSVTDEGKAEQLVQRILKGDENLVGNSKDLLEAIKVVEARTGKSLVEPLKKALAIRQVEGAKMTKISGLEGLLTSPLGVAAEASKGSIPRVAGRAADRIEALGGVAEKAGKKASGFSAGLANAASRRDHREK